MTAGTGGDHVARRAHHRPRRRQRHVRADLHLDHQLDPGQAIRLYQTENGPFTVIAIALLALIVITLVVYVEQAQRRIPVQYAKRMIGRRAYGGHLDLHPAQGEPGRHHPGHLRQLAALPAAAAQQALSDETSGWRRFIHQLRDQAEQLVAHHAVLRVIIFFTYFYVAITFNPEESADDMKKYGGFIPGIRPGRPTEEYLAYVLNRITFHAGDLPGHRRGPAELLPGHHRRREQTRTSPSAHPRC
jgi:preprotein translocase subunit SecY